MKAVARACGCSTGNRRGISGVTIREEFMARRFLIFAFALIAGCDYGSPNYRWFSERYEQFLYLDRIIVDRSWRRRGVATMTYDAMESVASAFGRQLCEVDLEPPNVQSLAFHAARGYEQVGELTVPSGKTRSMLAKELGGSTSGCASIQV